MPTLMRKNPQPSPTSLRAGRSLQQPGVAEKGNFGDDHSIQSSHQNYPTYEKAHNNLGLARQSRQIL